MAFLTFEPRIQSYISAKKLLAPNSVNQPASTAPTRRLADETHPTSSQPQAHIDIYQQEDGQPAVHPLERAITAEQIMTTPVISMLTNTLLGEARLLFREHRFRHVPLVSKDNKIIGIVSDRDLLHHPMDDPLHSVNTLAIERVVVATPETEIREIAGVFFRQHIGAMPIINDKENLIGIITRSDILRALVNRAPFEMWV
ncbi:HPP family protein [Pseudomonadota bacterium]